MSKATHTPGEWNAFPHYASEDPDSRYAEYRLIGIGQFDTIAEVRHGHDDIPGDVDANARLIAAAPDLLEALEAVLNTSGARGKYHSLKYSEAVENAEAAIAKARGE